MEKIQTKSVQVVINFNKPLFPNQIRGLLLKAIGECNNIFRERRKALPFLKRIFTPHEIYYFNCEWYMFCSYDGKAPMRFCKYALNSEEYPDARYETRYSMSICGIRDYRLYFDVIPGIAKENQFGTLIREYEPISSITIKANMKSSPYWQAVQKKFLDEFVPIIDNLNKKFEATEWVVSFFFYKKY